MPIFSSSNLQREKVTPEVTNDTTIKVKKADNFFLNMPEHYTISRRGAVGNNGIPYVSPYYSMKVLGSRRQCSTSPELRTEQSCENITYP